MFRVIYQFELKVTENEGLSAKDTIQVRVNDSARAGRPVANAGPDQTKSLPGDTANLDESACNDADNNIVNYLWLNISGPSFSISNPIQFKLILLIL